MTRRETLEDFIAWLRTRPGTRVLVKRVDPRFHDSGMYATLGKAEEAELLAEYCAARGEE